MVCSGFLTFPEGVWMQVTGRQGCDRTKRANHLTTRINPLSTLWFGVTAVSHPLVLWIRKPLGVRGTQNQLQMATFCVYQHSSGIFLFCKLIVLR